MIVLENLDHITLLIAHCCLLEEFDAVRIRACNSGLPDAPTRERIAATCSLRVRGQGMGLVVFENNLAG
jgi:hypothetical protein